MTSTTVLFDGGCHLCSREIDHYRRLDTSGALTLVDITGPHFDASAYHVDAAEVHRNMHVRRPDGTWAIGVDAFIAIWQVIPRYHWAARLAAPRPVHAVLSAGYAVFARIRPYLPRRLRATCDDGACQTHQSPNAP